MTVFMVSHKQREHLCKTDPVTISLLLQVFGFMHCYFMFCHFAKIMYFGYPFEEYYISYCNLSGFSALFFHLFLSVKAQKAFMQERPYEFLLSLKLHKVMMMPCSKVLTDSSGKCGPCLLALHI